MAAIIVLVIILLVLVVLYFTIGQRGYKYTYWTADASPTVNDVIAKYREIGLDQLASSLEKDVLPCISVRHAGRGRSPKSKLGGLPNLPPDVAWPKYNGKSLSFVAQIDLSEIPQTPLKDLLPDRGMLYFFYDQNQGAWGFDPKHKGAGAVIFTERPLDSQMPAPADLPKTFVEIPVEMTPGLSLPNTEGYAPLESLNPQQGKQAWDVLDEYERLNNCPCHRLFGHAEPIQSGNMQLECQLASHGINVDDYYRFETPQAKELAPGASNWRLLFQVDTDFKAKMMWVDAGTLYFWITEADLRRRQFQNVWTVLQCF